ncbi:methyl-accepting chemotaxis protein [Vibrio harveyi]|uniref:methyl-accepting chemotaxis protein n=1 Tax=Vibrio harveyi TaxID=669 RepID=UPI003CF299F7
MSIKQSIALLFLFWGFSFSAFAEYLTVTTYGGNYHLVTGCTGVDIGSVVKVGSRSLGNSYDGGTCESVTVSGKQISVSWRNRKGLYSGSMYGSPAPSCPSDQVLNPETGKCEESYCEKKSTIEAIESARLECESSGKQFSYTCSDKTQSWESECNGRDCSDVEGERGQLRWKSSVWGESVPSSYLCSSKGGGCAASVTQDTSLCFNESGWCYGDYVVIGPACDVPSGPSFCSDPECKGFKPEPDKPPTDPDNPDHKPDDPTGGDIEDPSVLPDSDNDVVVPDKPDDKPDVEDPDIKPETDKAVVDAVVGMNKDVNKALNDLHISINKNKADVQNEIRVLNASVVTNTQAVQKQQINDNEIYRKTKALIQQANADITTAVNRNTGAINSVGEDVGKIAGSMEGIAEDVAGISETLDGIANTDTSGAGIGGTCIQAGNCKGFYNSGYPQGLNGLVSGQLENLKNNTIDKFVNSFGKMDLSNAKRPSFVLPVPFFGDFSFEAYINFDWIFGFVRACLIMTSIFAARRIIFGG